MQIDYDERVWLRTTSLLVLLLPCGVTAGDLEVCLEDRVGLGPAARTAFERELETHLPVRLSPATSTDSGCILIQVRTVAPQRYASALGLVYRTGERILPVIEVYVRPVVALLDREARADLLGRAIARVAAHELVHYSEQRGDHENAGLFRASLSARELVGSLTRAPR